MNRKIAPAKILFFYWTDTTGDKTHLLRHYYYTLYMEFLRTKCK
jgi:hypothetical protein